MARCAPSAPPWRKAVPGWRRTRREPSEHVLACPWCRQRRFLWRWGENSSTVAQGPPSPAASRGHSRHTRHTWEAAGFSLPDGHIAGSAKTLAPSWHSPARRS